MWTWFGKSLATMPSQRSGRMFLSVKAKDGLPALAALDRDQVQALADTLSDWLFVTNPNTNPEA